MSPLHPSQLRAFVAIVETGRLNAAARRVGMAPSSVTRRLQDLETDLGIALIERTSSKLEVTQWGRAFYPHALEVLRAIDGALESVRSLQSHPTGPLRVVSPSAFGRAYVAAGLSEFLNRYPDINVSLVLDNRLTRLAEMEADVAFVIGNPADGDERMRKLGSVPFRVVASPSCLADIPQLTHPSDLAPLRFLSVARQSDHEHWRFVRDGEDAEVEVKPTASAFDPLVVSDLARAGAGFAVLSELFCRDDLTAGRLVEILPEWRIDARQDYAMLFTAAGATLPRVRAFIDHFAEYLNPVFAAARQS